MKWFFAALVIANLLVALISAVGQSPKSNVNSREINAQQIKPVPKDAPPADPIAAASQDPTAIALLNNQSPTPVTPTPATPEPAPAAAPSALPATAAIPAVVASAVVAHQAVSAATEPKPEPKKVEPKPEPKKPEPKPELKKVEPKVEPKPEPKPEPKKVEPKVEPKPEPKPEPKKVEPKAEPKHEPQIAEKKPKAVEPDPIAKKFAETEKGTSKEASKPAASAMCYQLAELDSQQSARFRQQMIRAKLADSAVEHKREAPAAANTSSGPKKYWVYLSAKSSRDEANKLSAEVKGKGFDNYVVTNADFKNAISIGLFSQESSAESMKKRLAQAGYTAHIQTRDSSGASTTSENSQLSTFRFRQLDSAAYEKLKTMSAQWPQATLKEIACRK